jgi:hypothetical protein
MSVSISDPQVALAKASQIIGHLIPTAKCELQDYDFRIGCGDMDQWGKVQDVKVAKQDWNEDAFQHAAEVLLAKLKSGGSTAGSL